MAEKPSKQGGEKPQEKQAEKPRAGRPQQGPSKPIISASGKEVRQVVRLVGKDLKGNLPLRRAITSVKAFSRN